MSILNNVRHIRQQLDLSQSELAAALNVGRSQVSNFETGWSNPSIEVAFSLVRIAGEQGISLTIDDVYKCS